MDCSLHSWVRLESHLQCRLEMCPAAWRKPVTCFMCHLGSPLHSLSCCFCDWQLSHGLGLSLHPLAFHFPSLGSPLLHEKVEVS